MYKKPALIFVALSVLTIGSLRLVFPPIHTESVTEQDGKRIEKSYERYWEILPIQAWGFTPEYGYWCGFGSGGGSTYTRRFGFIGLSEDHNTAFVKVKSTRDPIVDIAAIAR